MTSARDPVGLVYCEACAPRFGAAEQMQQLCERAARAMRAAFRGRYRRNASRLRRRAGIVVHEPRRARAAGRVDQEQRAGCAVDGNALSAFLPWRGQGGGLQTQNVDVRINGAG